MLNQAMSSLEKASGGSFRLSESFETQEAQRDRHRSEIEAIKLEMPSLEVLEETGRLFAKLQRGRAHLGTDACSRGGETGS